MIHAHAGAPPRPTAHLLALVAEQPRQPPPHRSQSDAGAWIVMAIIMVLFVAGFLFLVTRIAIAAEGLPELRSLAEARGWSFVPNRPRASWLLTGTFRGVPFEADVLYRGRYGPHYGRVQGTAPIAAGGQLVVSPRTEANPQRPRGRELGVVPTGDGAFDAQYVVETDDPGLAQRVLAPPVRAAVLAQLPRRIALEVQGGRPTLTFHPKSVDGIEPTVALLALMHEHAARG